jgi:hypothetical protein
VSADLHGAIADWLNARDLEDEDGFSKRAASRIASLESWDVLAIRTALVGIQTDLFRRNSGVRKAEVLDDLATHVASRLQNKGERKVMAAEKCKIVFFAANPVATTHLDLAEEVRDITEKIRATKFRDTIELTTAWAARPDDLLQYLNEHEATIVHFSGHGGGTSGLVLQDNAGKPALVSSDALEALFKSLKHKVRLVVLNACNSSVQARAMASEIDCVIGMRLPISDDAARIFAASLYRAIGFGCSVQTAFDQGKVALMLQGIKAEDTPELICRKGVTASLVKLIRT